MTKDTFSRIDAFALTGRSDIIYPYTQGVALGYVLLPLRGVLLVSFDTPPTVNHSSRFTIKP